MAKLSGTTSYDKLKGQQNITPQMEPGLRVSDIGRVGHGSLCQIRCLTRFWVSTCVFIVVLFLQT